MPHKPTLTRGYQDAKTREQRIDIQLAGKRPHALPRIAQVNEGWVADQNTLEIELETGDGQRVIVPLAGQAIVDLGELIDQVMKMRNTDDAS